MYWEVLTTFIDGRLQVNGKRKVFQFFLSSIKTKVAVKFPEKLFFFFFSAKNRLGAERVNDTPLMNL